MFCAHTPTTAFYTLSLHDALPIYVYSRGSDQLEFSTHSVPDFDDYRAQSTVFEDMAGYSMMFAAVGRERPRLTLGEVVDRKSTRLNSSHSQISYAVFCLKKKNNKT